ncbi:cytochrome C oxidase subunit I [Haloferax mediterranei ATCC 33500]|uniref:Cytochrome C oxidase subunit I n=1 Tax=Haloferax mediterranei (strain ATCC 33500 / DSM 1411 / JCM 8866 / NBRC 14739 / NCIMB 2177 / R-4) TaxID=523841 RepID=I3R5D3_HALMT|nr:DUF6789 family protein [Haloferax mediterranei]AFK19443.1 hypothetical protein HFX_1737 [Haloferax mediterranei ATCC 33500]AHZ21208.1 cytochrome C oxidase subunit I [Haloferax mediterranei ATCC 33500]EMA04368.1 hypothetical protein C439_01797 [Haloferax mediterranei ATCC 33500]MDX5989546.1 DUF6789 family protein [Haloferax mediterranei ATCC 33500]QCQ75904.1 cytochrome C oxidase subunit I [Haloferax mediterranei ATCC 33500]
MSQETPTTATTVEQHAGETVDPEITGRVIVTAMAGGFIGTVLMLPVLVGIPDLLGLFVTEPITRFAGFAAFFGYEPTLLLGVFLFGIGGVVALPVTFVVVGAFLPPESPEYLRGVSFATLYWAGFVPAFWPGADVFVTASFIVFSLLAHWVYGLALGYTLDRFVGIPQHEV